MESADGHMTMPTDTQRAPSEADQYACGKEVLYILGANAHYIPEHVMNALIAAIAQRVREAGERGMLGVDDTVPEQPRGPLSQRIEREAEAKRPLSAPTAPSPDYVVTIARDGDMHCALCGPNLQEGTAGFGPTVSDALYDLADNWEAPHA